MEDLRGLVPLLEQPWSESDLDDVAATRLVEFVVCRPWSDYWVAYALDWIEAGISSDEIADALRSISQDKAYSQRTRHRAWRYLKPRPAIGSSDPAFVCPVCSFAPLEHPPYAGYTGTVPPEATPPYDEFLGRASYGVCPRCGFEFGNDDNPGTAAPSTFEEYRRDWQSRGAPWFDPHQRRE